MSDALFIKFNKVLRDELDAIRKRRERLPGKQISHKSVPEQVSVATARQTAFDMNLVGLTFSGGGIRSGTLAVGFLEGLAKLRLLRLIDYLSTVSGGGYAGAWFAAWVKREGDLENVEKQLDTSRHSQGEVPRKFPDSTGNTEAVDLWSADKFEPKTTNRVVDQEPEPVNHLRAYTRYMTPQAGLFSADTWTLIASYLRNTTINLCIITVMTMVPLFVARWLVWGFAQSGSSVQIDMNVNWVWFWGIVGFFSGLIAIIVMTIYRTKAAWAADDPTQFIETSESHRWVFVVGIVIPILIASVTACWCLGSNVLLPDGAPTGSPRFDWAYANSLIDNNLVGLAGKEWLKENEWARISLKYGLLFLFPVIPFCLISLIVRWCYGVPTDLNKSLTWSGFLQLTATGVFLALAIFFAIRPLAGMPNITPLPPLGPAAVVTLGPPAILIAFILGGIVEAMFFGRWLKDYELEWRGKLLGYLFMAAIAWFSFFATAFYLPHIIWWVTHTAGVVAVIVWSITTVGGVVMSNRPPQPGILDRVLRILLKVAPVVFIVGFIALVSKLVSAILSESIASGPTFVTCLADLYWILGGVVICIVTLFFLNTRTGANNYSFHNLYGNRLIRCYLGASRAKACVADPDKHPSFPGGAPTGVGGFFRRQNPITGFDPDDDFALADLNPTKEYCGPYPLFNTALQLIAGDQLAWQDRKAASFTLAPCHWGCEGTGWAETTTEASWLTVGEAMTTSGAAVDPNMANYQSGPLTAFLTVFNARTGIWVRNPRTWASGGLNQSTSDWFGLPRGLTLELLGQTNELRSHVHLSDGGGFENLGVYELIRRRCRYVVACDFAEDPNDASENLANLIRKVGVDFGIRIEIDTSPVRQDKEGLSARHVATGVIHYEDVDEKAAAGTLVFVRSSLTGDESPAIRQYADTHPKFPHQSTSNQFFDADQFEAYRALGEHMASVVFAPVAGTMDWKTLIKDDDHDDYHRAVRALFAVLRREWYPEPTSLRAEYAQCGEVFDRLVAGLSSEPKLAELVRKIYPELNEHNPSKDAPPHPNLKPVLDGLADVDATRLLAVNQLINSMEVTWLKLDLDKYCAHPINRGWVNEFRRWTVADDFQKFWPVLRGEYSPGFVRFCERQLNAPEVSIVLVPYDTKLDPAWVKLLNKEFMCEWCQQANMWPNLDVPYLNIEKAVQCAVEATVDGTNQPLVWFAQLTHARETHMNYPPVGVIVLYERSGKNTDKCVEIEVLMWFRGAYRSLGLGRAFIDSEQRPRPETGGADSENIKRKLYKRIEKALIEKYGKTVKLVARYPGDARTGAERLQEISWSNFFYDYDFRRPRQLYSQIDAVINSEQRAFIILERELVSDNSSKGVS